MALSHPRASAITYLCAHQNSKWVPPVLIHRAITCDSFKVLAQKAYEELCDNQKKDPKSYFMTSSDPQTCPQDKIFAHCILLFITFDLICNMTMFVQNGVWTFWGHTMLALPPGVTTKFWMCFYSPHPKGYHLWKFRGSSLNGLGAMVCHYRRTDGWTVDITGGSQVDLRQHTM